MSKVILQGYAPVTPSALVLLLHDVAKASPTLAPTDVLREGGTVRLEYAPHEDEGACVVSLYLTHDGKHSMAVLESSGSGLADRQAQDLMRRVLRIARGEESL